MLHFVRYLVSLIDYLFTEQFSFHSDEIDRMIVYIMTGKYKFLKFCMDSQQQVDIFYIHVWVLVRLTIEISWNNNTE